MSKYHLLISLTCNYTYEIESRPSLSFPIINNILSGHNIFVKLDFILKISGTCINYIFRKYSMFVENDSILISTLRKQWISLLSVFAT